MLLKIQIASLKIGKQTLVVIIIIEPSMEERQQTEICFCCVSDRANNYSERRFANAVCIFSLWVFDLCDLSREYFMSGYYQKFWWDLCLYNTKNFERTNIFDERSFFGILSMEREEKYGLALNYLLVFQWWTWVFRTTCGLGKNYRVIKFCTSLVSAMPYDRDYVSN